jgi:hypothetical protein
MMIMIAMSQIVDADIRHQKHQNFMTRHWRYVR